MADRKMIYLDDAIKALEEIDLYKNNMVGKLGVLKSMLVLLDLPSAQSIIRCKDCKHSEYWYRDKRRCFLWAEDGIDVFDDGFCNYAERKQDG